MTIVNNLSVFIARRRWLKRLLLEYLPSSAYKKIFQKFYFYFDPRDMRGPSFHFAYDLEKGFNNYEQHTKDQLLQFLPENGVFYDIGANIGMYSVYFLLNKPSCRLYAFEPEPLAFQCIQSTLKNMNTDFHLYNVAIGNCNEERQIFKSSTNDGGHSFYNNSQEGKYEVVKIVNLDAFRKEESIPAPNIVKIDVEGFELEVLKGMKATILESRPIMQVESSNKDLSQKGSFWQFLQEFESEGLFVMDPKSSEKFNLEQLSKLASTRIEEGHPLSDYFFMFQS